MIDFLTGTIKIVRRTITTKHIDKRGLILTTYVYLDGKLQDKKEIIL